MFDVQSDPMLYFDHNATHPLSRVAREAWLDAVERFPANPSSPHRLGARADAALQRAREKLAGWLGGEPIEIVWTSGATESNNAALHHLAGREGEAWVSAIEHPSLLAAARRYFADRFRVLPHPVNPEWLCRELESARPACIAVMAANNETGALLPWREIAEVCRERDVPFLCDAAQWVGKLPAHGLGECALVSGCAHKFGGPQGVGFLKSPPQMRALLVGGPQEEGRRAGTENVAGVLALVAALEERERVPAAEGKRAVWRDAFEREVLAALPGAEVVASDAPRLWNTSAIIMPELADCRQRWVVKLDKLGSAVSTGSACSSGKEQPSHVLSTMGYTPAQAGRVLRFSSGWETTEDDWCALLGRVIQAERELG
jgi:cysteine desulfurase